MLSNNDADLVNYYPLTLTKEDRKRNPNMFKNNTCLVDSDKTKKQAASGDWVFELKKTKAAQPVPDAKKGKAADNVINLDTSDDELRFDSEENVMVVDEFVKKEVKTKIPSPLMLEDEEEEPNPYEHTTTTLERNRLYQGQTQEVEFDQNPWLQ